MDVESTQNRQRLPPNAAGGGSTLPPNIIPARHPYNIIKRLSIISFCIWGLHKLEVYHTILHSPKVSHTWFKVGLASSVAILAAKSYVELYAGKIQKRKVTYDNFRSETHGILFLIILSSLSFHVALWPAFGGLKTIGIMAMVGYGILLQFMLLVPTYVQNAVGAVLMTFFIQQYV